MNSNLLGNFVWTELTRRRVSWMFQFAQFQLWTMHVRIVLSLSFFFYKLQVFCDQELFSATFGSSVSNLSDLSPCDSCLKRLHFALRFWNQVLTCRSVNPSTLDNCFLSGGDKYFWFSNIFSNSIVCSLEKRTWPPFFFWGFGKNRFQAPKKV